MSAESKLDHVCAGSAPSAAPADAVQLAAEFLGEKLGPLSPKAAIVLGSGLGGLADAVANGLRIPYSEIPGFPTSTVVGHSGELIAGELEGVPVVLQSGRFHMYEGHDPGIIALPVRVFASLGVRFLFVTNAAGGISPNLRPPTLMLIADHINFMWRNPLTGPVAPLESRWPDMFDAYDSQLRSIARDAALEAGVPLGEGVYLGLLGPSFETPAEIRMLRRLGADAVGMSTVPEVVAARALDIRVLGISSVTNLGAGISPTKLSHLEVLEAGKELARGLESVVRGVLARLPD